MSKWNDLITKRNEYERDFRKEFLEKMNNETGRDIIVHYSTWQSKSAPGSLLSISQDDRISFQSAIDGLNGDCEELDLILHTPGGDIQATKMIVHALRKRYKHIRVIVPITAMSAGTMIALSADEIILTDSSNLGPIDPQIYLKSIDSFIPANEIDNVVNNAKKEIASKKNINYWGFELNKYPAAIHQMCLNTIKQSKLMTREWLKNGMLRGEKNAEQSAIDIEKYFSNYQNHLTHGNHLTYDELTSALPRLKISLADKELSDLIYGVFYAYDIFAMSVPQMVKVTENHKMVGRLKLFNGLPVK
jgi:hypothetical protein